MTERKKQNKDNPEDDETHFTCYDLRHQGKMPKSYCGLQIHVSTVQSLIWPPSVSLNSEYTTSEIQKRTDRLKRCRSLWWWWRGVTWGGETWLVIFANMDANKQVEVFCAEAWEGKDADDDDDGVVVVVVFGLFVLLLAVVAVNQLKPDFVLMLSNKRGRVWDVWTWHQVAWAPHGTERKTPRQKVLEAPSVHRSVQGGRGQPLTTFVTLRLLQTRPFHAATG